MNIKCRSAQPERVLEVSQCIVLVNTVLVMFVICAR